MRLPLFRDVLAHSTDAPDGPRIERERAVVWLVPVDDDACVVFAAEVARSMVALGVSPTIVVETMPAGAVGTPGAFMIPHVRFIRLPSEGDEARAKWQMALDESGPVVAVGTRVGAFVAPNFTLAIGAGSLVSPRFRDVRASIDAVLTDARPVFARWLGGRMTTTLETSDPSRISALVPPGSSG